MHVETFFQRLPDARHVAVAAGPNVVAVTNVVAASVTNVATVLVMNLVADAMIHEMDRHPQNFAITQNVGGGIVKLLTARVVVFHLPVNDPPYRPDDCHLLLLPVGTAPRRRISAGMHMRL